MLSTIHLPIIVVIQLTMLNIISYIASSTISQDPLLYIPPGTTVHYIQLFGDAHLTLEESENIVKAVQNVLINLIALINNY